MKSILVAAFAVLIMAGGYIGYSQYEEHKFIASLTPHVKYSSVCITTAASYEGPDETNITFEEIFRRLDAYISEVNKRLFEAQTTATQRHKDIADPALEYIRGRQSLLRAMLRSRLKEMEASLKILENAAREFQEAILSVSDAASRMKELRAKASLKLPIDALVDVSVLDVGEE